ncbi:MAG: DNA repair exonuclease SbcCD ATPase subunit [Rhodoferax sp.]|jgi:DNA repair exonuclease SbcCD ATPase subunit
MENNHTFDNALQAEIEILRSQHPETQVLYREVCILLFFRHGMTPTTNKLYQLVRKGSMSAPAEALQKFWGTLREKSRIRIEHPDLPDTLRDTAGEMVGALWQRAQDAAGDALQTLRDETQALVEQANDKAKNATVQVQTMTHSLDAAQQNLQSWQQRWQESQTNLAHAQGEVVTLQHQVAANAVQNQTLQASFETAQQRFAGELAQQRSDTLALTERHAVEVKRWLLEVDRERLAVTKHKKEREQAQRLHTEQAEAHRRQDEQKQEAVDSLRQVVEASEKTVSQLKRQCQQLTQEQADLQRRFDHQALDQQTKVNRTRRTLRAAARTVPVKRSL